MLLLEKAQLTHGSTWHAAGLVGQLRGKRNLTRLMQNSVAVFDRLEAETGQAIDWQKVGSLRLASSPERWSEIRRSMTQAKSFGFECHSAVGATRRSDRFPFIDDRRRRRRRLHPVRRLCRSLCADHGLRRRRAGRAASRIEEGVTVTDIVARRPARRRRRHRPRHDRLRHPRQLRRHLGEARRRDGGRRARRRRRRAPVFRHREDARPVDADLTTLRDPDQNFYLKPDVGAFAIGGWEDGTQGLLARQAAVRFRAASCSRPTWTGSSCSRCRAAERLPVLNEIGIQTVINGPIPVSADGEPIMGLAPELDNFYRRLRLHRRHRRLGRRRRGDGQLDPRRRSRHGPLAVRRAPLRPAAGARPLSRGARHRGLRRLLQDPLARRGDACARAACAAARSTTRLDAAGAVYGSKFGWERPNWFARAGRRARRSAELRGQAQLVRRRRREHRGDPRARRAHRPDLVLQVRDVGAGRRCAACSASPPTTSTGPVGQLRLHPALQRQGGIEADVTAHAARDDRFYVVTGSGFGVRDMGWIARHLPQTVGAASREVTSAYARRSIVVGPQGARRAAGADRRRPLQRRLPLSHRRARSRSASPACARRASAMSASSARSCYMPAEYARARLRHAVAGGRSRTASPMPATAPSNRCRLEKGYLYWSADITPDTNPYEAGLGFCVRARQGRLHRPRGARRDQGRGPGAQARHLDGRRLRAASSAARRSSHDGKVVGSMTSAGYGHTRRQDHRLRLCAGRRSPRTPEFEIEAFGKRYAATRGAAQPLRSEERAAEGDEAR